MKFIDSHTHITPDQADLAVRIMDAAEIDAVVTAEWFNGYSAAFPPERRFFRQYPGRFLVFGAFEPTDIDEPGAIARAVEGIRRDADAGMAGIKVYKQLGLGYRDRRGELLRVSDERLDPVWAVAGELGLPVLIHTADPRAFWEPIDAANPWQLVFDAYPEWSYYRKGLPSRDELLAERNAVVRRHPNTNFIGPHLGSWEDDFGTLTENLAALPNLHVDISARFFSMAVTEARRRAARKLCIDFADRILFGTDTILVGDTAPTDVQPQTFLTPARLPPRFGKGDKGTDTFLQTTQEGVSPLRSQSPSCPPTNRLLATSVWFYEFHKTFLATARTQRPIPFLCQDPGLGLKGLALPEDVLAKVCSGNTERLIGRR